MYISQYQQYFQKETFMPECLYTAKIGTIVGGTFLPKIYFNLEFNKYIYKPSKGEGKFTKT